MALRRGGGLAARRCLLLSFTVFFLWVVVVLQPAGSLKVTMESRMMAFLDTNVTIPCNISEYNTQELNIAKMAVYWYRKASSKEEENSVPVYTIFSGEPEPHRNGSRMNESELIKGNAALSLSQIQISEEGIYKCSVTVTPESSEGTTAVEVIAQPSIEEFPRTVELENGKEKTLSCKANKLYPPLIEIHWEKKSEHGNNEVIHADDICTSVPVKNGDGTFNVTSKLRLQPSLQDNGNVYSCVVGHKSFSTPQTFNTTLIVLEPPPNYSWLALIAILFLLAVIAVFLYVMFFKKTQPEKMLEVANKELKYLEETQVKFWLKGFRPKNLEIVFSLKLQSWNEKQEIYSWNTKRTSNPEHREDKPLLIPGKGGESSDLVKELKAMFTFDPTLQIKQRRTFDISCAVRIVPGLKLLGEFELTLEVRHDAFPDCLSTETIAFKVVAIPSMDQIVCPTDVPKQDEPLTLSCRIHSYFPQEIDIEWYKNDDIVSYTPFVSKKAPDGLFFCNSSINYVPKASDLEKKFVCKAKLCGTQWCKESSWCLKNLECTPKVSKFQCEPPVPECGKLVTLSCLVEDFYPVECDVCWLRDRNEIWDATSKTEEPQWDPVSNLYSKKSSVSFIPQLEDHAVDFTVQIKHGQKVIRHCYPVLLKGYPKVTDITCEPNDPKYGTTLSLTCKVTDFYPSNINIQWLDKGNEKREGVVNEGPVEGPNGCLMLSSTLQMIPTALDYNKFITFSVTYGNLKKPIIRNVYLKLPVHRPEMSEIKATPMQNRDSISLETVISNFAPCNIKVMWFEEWKKISEDNPRNIPIGENKLGCFVSKFQFNPKGKESKKTIRCEVVHQATEDFKEKCFVWKGKDYCDSLERMSTSPMSQKHLGPLINSNLIVEEPAKTMKIECVTPNPKAGEKVALRCFVPGIRAEEASVSWSKGVYPVDNNIENENCGDGSGFISDVTIITEKDKKKYEIRCEVYADGETLEKIFYLEF